MILLIDNYDSFAHNLARYFARLGLPVRVVRNDAIEVDEVRRMGPVAVVISPGPCTPSEAGVSLAIVRELHASLPILGICLGHQAIAAALGGRVVRAPEPVHGRTAAVLHGGEGVFAGLPSPLVVCRYHSLVVEEATLPRELRVTARTDDGVVMAIEHRTLPVVGLQFHPESILTDHGYELLAAFVRRAGLPVGEPLPTLASELRPSAASEYPLPQRPVTF